MVQCCLSHNISHEILVASYLSCSLPKQYFSNHIEVIIDTGGTESSQSTAFCWFVWNKTSILKHSKYKKGSPQKETLVFTLHTLSYRWTNAALGRTFLSFWKYYCRLWWLMGMVCIQHSMNFIQSWYAYIPKVHIVDPNVIGIDDLEKVYGILWPNNPLLLLKWHTSKVIAVRIMQKNLSQQT